MSDTSRLLVEAEAAQSCCSTKQQGLSPHKPEIKTLKFRQRLSESITRYQPLVVIFLASLVGGSFAGIAHGGIHGFETGMRVSMGLFLLPLALLKLFDIKSFASGFATYDPIAKQFFSYALIYPWLEAGAALLLIAGLWMPFALILTALLLGPTTFGIAQSLRRGIDLNCACVGIAFKLPLGWVSLIENSVMTGMAVFMLWAMIA